MTHFDFEQLQGIRDKADSEFDDAQSQQAAFWLVLNCIEEYAPAEEDLVINLAIDDVRLEPASQLDAIEDTDAYRHGSGAGIPEFMKAKSDRDAALAPAADETAEVEPVPENVEVAPEPEIIKTTAVAPKPRAAPAEAMKSGEWDRSEIDHLIKSRNKGHSLTEIALQLNRPVKAVQNKNFRLIKDGAFDAPKPQRPARPPVKSASIAPTKDTPKPLKPAPAAKSLAEGGLAILPRPHPDPKWTPEDDLDLVSMHHSGSDMATVAINLERDKPECVDRYNALIRAMPETSMQAAQVRLKQTVKFYAEAERAKGKAA